MGKHNLGLDLVLMHLLFCSREFYFRSIFYLFECVVEHVVVGVRGVFQKISQIGYQRGIELVHSKVINIQ